MPILHRRKICTRDGSKVGIAMAARVFPVAAVGSLLKGSTIPRDAPREKRTKAGKTRKGRTLDPKYLALIRRCPCISCDTDPARVAAHIRYPRPGQPPTGIGVKPSDRDSTPLCPRCHTDAPGAQHTRGEREWWAALGIDPHALADDLAAAAPSIEKMRAVVFRTREGRK